MLLATAMKKAVNDLIDTVKRAYAHKSTTFTWAWVKTYSEPLTLAVFTLSFHIFSHVS